MHQILQKEAEEQGAAELTRFLYIALGSLSELETQMEITARLCYINKNEEIFNRIYFIKNMLSKLIESLNKKERL